MRRIVALSVVLAGCPLPGKPEVGNADSAATEAPTLAGCTEDRVYTGATESGTVHIVYASDLRAIEYADDWVDEDGTSSFTEEARYDEAGCLTQDDYGFTWDSVEYGRMTSTTSTLATCDEHANWLEAAYTFTSQNEGEEPWTDEVTASYTNTYDGDFVLEELREDSDGDTMRWTYTWTDGHLASFTDYWPADRWRYTSTYTYDDRGNESFEETAYEDGGTTSRAYTYDDLDRVIEEVYVDDEYEYPDAVTTFSYADDVWLWPSAHETDEGDDGTVDQTATYTYECP